MAVDAGADLVLGSGPHVLRAMELYHGRLIAYSLGNFAGYHNFTLEGVLGESVVLHVTLAADGRVPVGPARLGEARGRRASRCPIRPAPGRALVAQLSRSDLGARGVRVGAGRRHSRAAGRRPHFQGLTALPPSGHSSRTASVAITRLTLRSAPRRASAPATALPPSAVVDVASTPGTRARKAADMIKWNHRTLRVALALAAIASFVVSSGAGVRWVASQPSAPWCSHLVPGAADKSPERQ